MKTLYVFPNKLIFSQPPQKKQPKPRLRNSRNKSLDSRHRQHRLMWHLNLRSPLWCHSQVLELIKHCQWWYNKTCRSVDVSENSGFSSKSSLLIRFSIINHPFWGTPIFGNTPVVKAWTFFFQKQTNSLRGKQILPMGWMKIITTPVVE